MHVARHENGAQFSAADIDARHPLKSGPWFCIGNGCTVRFKFHRAGGPYRLGEQRYFRQATFVHSDDREHGPQCEYNAQAERQRLLNEHSQVLIRRGDKILLRYEASPATPPGGAQALPRGRGALRESYAAVVETSLDVARTVDRLGEEVIETYWVRHKGTDYTWTEFAYGPLADDLARLAPSVAAQQIPDVWPRFVRAIVADTVVVGQAGKNVWVRLRARGKLPSGAYVRLRVFAREGSEAAVALRGLKPGEPCAVLGHRWHHQAETPNVVGVTIEDPHQIVRGW